jgi:hypothetical protein
VWHRLEGWELRRHKGPPDLGRYDGPLRAAGRDNIGVGGDQELPLRRNAARHDPVDTHECQHTLPAKAAVATERGQPKGSAVRGGFRVHRLQSAEQGEDDKCRRTHSPRGMRSVQPVRAAVSVPVAGRHHAHLQGAGKRSGGQPGSPGDDRGRGQTGGIEQQDCSGGSAVAG